MQMNSQNVIIDRNIKDLYQNALTQYTPDIVFILTDENTHKACLPCFVASLNDINFQEIIITPNDQHKDISTLSSVWEYMSNHQGSRKSILINLGGGVVTDLGGFAATTFKRGINFINVPTTLLAIVDASIGGKTGINYNGLKNEIGAFAPAKEVWINVDFLHTLSEDHLLSGFAEMLKHGLIYDEKYFRQLQRWDFRDKDWHEMEELIKNSIHIKQEIVASDPYEKGIRKALNFGHTVGHAFEAWSMHKGEDVQHGYAVAWGMICELYLSHVLLQFPLDSLRSIGYYLKELYGNIYFTCHDYEEIYSYMLHDKKNNGNGINFTLLSRIGKATINQTANKDLIFEMFDFYRECMGI